MSDSFCHITESSELDFLKKDKSPKHTHWAMQHSSQLGRFRTYIKPRLYYGSRH